MAKPNQAARPLLGRSKPLTAGGGMRVASLRAALPSRTLLDHGARTLVAQRELDRVLNKLIQAPAPASMTPPTTTSPTSPPAVAAQAPAPPATSPIPAASTPLSGAAVEAPASPPAEEVPMWKPLGLTVLLVALLAATAFCIAIVSSQSLGAQAERTEGKLQQIGGALDDLHTQFQTFKRVTGGTIRSMQGSLAEIRHPPATFAAAQDAFAAHRWADAEAGFSLYATENPQGRMLDIAWYKATLAAAMLGNCTLGAAYADRIKTRFPGSQYGVEARAAAAECRAQARAQARS